MLPFCSKMQAEVKFAIVGAAAIRGRGRASRRLLTPRTATVCLHAMAVRPPRAFAKSLPADPITAALEQEVLAEKAATYARLMRRLEQALAALARHEAAMADSREAATAEQRQTRERLLDAAGEALWHVVIQRDLCGFRNSELFFRQVNVPRAVRLRMGLKRPR